jgi:cobalamin synthase
MKDLFSKDNRSDVLVGVFLVICLLLSSNVISSFMPSSVVMVAIALFVAAFCLFAVLIWRESPRDEREAHILLSSDRLGFLAGAIVLSVALVITSLRHESTNVLAICLTVMILGKLIGKYLKL